MAQSEYLNTSAMRATSCSMALASSVLGFDIVEIWSELEDGKLHCTFVHADDRMKERYPGIITGHYPQHKRVHKLSPRLCEFARKSPRRYHWRILDLGASMCNIPMDMLSIYENMAFPLKTEMAYQLQVDPEYGYVSGACFVVAFSVQAVQFRPSKLKFLTGISVAIVVAAFDLDEDAEETGRAIGTDEELDAKEFKGHHHSHYNDLLESKENTASVEHALASWTAPPEAPTSSGANGQGIGKPPSNGRKDEGDSSSSDDDEDDEDDDEEENKKAAEAAKAANGRAPVIPKYLGKAATQAPASKSMSHNAVIPTWEPASPFSYPISRIPSKYAIYDNLTFNTFGDVQHIADGSNANIFTGLLNGERVVIKMIKEFMEKDAIAINEFDVEYGTLARLDHQHIIRVLGAGRIPRRFIVLEHLGGGSLHDMLAKNQQSSGNKLQKLFHKPTFTYASLLTAAKAIAEAMHYLHAECHSGATIIHRDLKPDNIGFTKDGKVKLFDFGLCTCVKARSHPYDNYEMTGYTGSLRYMAPEVIQRKSYNEKADVYSFAIMLWQMARDKVPFKGYEKDEFVRQVVDNNERPKLDKSWPTGLSNLLRVCWDADPVQRPSFAKIVADINKLLNTTGTSESTDSTSAASAISEKEKRKGRMITMTEKSVSTSSWF